MGRGASTRGGLPALNQQLYKFTISARTRPELWRHWTALIVTDCHALAPNITQSQPAIEANMEKILCLVILQMTNFGEELVNVCATCTITEKPSEKNSVLWMPEFDQRD